MNQFRFQPCERRSYIDVLVDKLLAEYSKTKGKACDELTQIFADYNIDLAPCDFFNQKLYDILQRGDIYATSNYLLQNTTLPPYTVKILKEDWESLTDEEKKEVKDWFKDQGADIVNQSVKEFIAPYLKEQIPTPSPSQIKTTINKLNAISRYLNNLAAYTTGLSNTINTAAITVNTFGDIIDRLKSAIPPAELTLVNLAATPTGAAAVVARALQKVENFADKYDKVINGPSATYGQKGLDGAICSASRVVLFVSASLQGFQSIIELLITILESLIKEEIEAGALNPVEVSDTIRNLANNNTTLQSSYRGYTFEVRTDPTSPSVAPRRFAIAIDQYGATVFQSQKSFSSSTDILIRELKFQIDRFLG